MLVKITTSEKNNPPGKLADAELHFTEGPLAGFKLLGFAVWARRTGLRYVTFPARSYAVNGEGRSFSLLRSIDDATGKMENETRIRDLILHAYKDFEDACETEGHTPGTVTV